jgi:hypothetical protein
METFDNYRIHLFTFDTEVYNPQQYNSDTLEDIEDYDIQGGGGTAFEAIFDYLQTEKLLCEVEMKRYNQPVLLRATSDLMKLNKKRISLNPFGFHKKLDVQFEYLNNDNYVCNCDEVWCEGSCGVLNCGCIEVCRGRCGNDYDSY